MLDIALKRLNIVLPTLKVRPSEHTADTPRNLCGVYVASPENEHISTPVVKAGADPIVLDQARAKDQVAAFMAKVARTIEPSDSSMTKPLNSQMNWNKK